MTGTRVGPSSPQHLSRADHRQQPFATHPPSSPTAPAARMPSSRPSAAMTPRSPLSPQLEHYDPLRPTSPRNMNARPGNTQRRANTSSLKLPSLPRFHPANFPSAHSSAQTTPDPGASSPQPPSSPRTHQRVISDAQRHLYAHQREMISLSARASTPTQLDDPVGPRLAPLGSPGPVTPLELETENGDYLVAGARAKQSQPVAPEQLMDRLVKEETARQGVNVARRTGRQ